MNLSMTGWAIVCLVGLGGCSFERYEDCESRGEEDPWDEDDGHGAASPGGKGSGAAPAGGSGGGSATPSGGSAAGGAVPEPPRACAEERDCDPGYNCEVETNECKPTEQETCGELETEAACSNRRDCEPVYGGLNCSCGADCECEGGEPGCVCESFEFFVCRALP
jgi:hypothetical protein